MQGSIEAILAALQQLPQDESSDPSPAGLRLAKLAKLTLTWLPPVVPSIVGFNTTLAPGARQAADRLGVDVRDYEVIYNLLDDIQGAMEGLLDPEMVEEPLGQVEVRGRLPGFAKVLWPDVMSCPVKVDSQLQPASRVRRGRGSLHR